MIEKQRNDLNGNEAGLLLLHILEHDNYHYIT